MKKVRLVIHTTALFAVGGSVLLLAVSTAMAAMETFTAGATLNGQGGWMAGTGNFTEAVGIVDTTSYTGLQSWHAKTIGSTPGSGTPFSPQLPASVGSPGCAVDPVDCAAGAADYGADGDRVQISFAIRAATPGDSSTLNVYEGAALRDDRTGTNVYFQAVSATETRVYTYCAIAEADYFEEVTVTTVPAGDWAYIKLDTTYPMTDPDDLTTWGETIYNVNGVDYLTCTPWAHWWRFKADWHNHYAQGQSLKFAGSATGNGFYVDDVGIRIFDTSDTQVLASYYTSFEADTNNPDSAAAGHYPTATNFEPSEFVVTTPLSQLVVTFDEELYDPSGNNYPHDVTNANNWLLVEAGPNEVFDTWECNWWTQADDLEFVVDSISWNAAAFEATLTVNSGNPLPPGSYRLFACGSASLVNLMGTRLNDGFDNLFDFNIPVPPSSGATTPVALPATGFAPNVVTSLAAQPADLAYSATDLTLNIPALGLRSSIVGVPQVGGSWDVSWLGNSVGYLQGTTFPTMQGNTVLTAHVWGANNRPGPFYGLEEMAYGERFTITAWGFDLHLRSAQQ